MFSLFRSFLPFRKVHTPRVVERTSVIQSFALRFKDIDIGYLSFDGEQWKFAYSPQFTSLRLRPLPDFPDLAKVYSSPELWSFFDARIPVHQKDSMARLLSKDRWEWEKLDLLKQHGRKFGPTPFELIPAGC